MVDTTKWPSAGNGVGFKAVADKIHGMDLKFGIHVMHGVPRVALRNPNATVLGMPDVTVASLSAGYACPWNENWFKIDMRKRGAQAYLDSIYAQYADWGVDFIKNDCVFGGNYDNITQADIAGARAAMDKAGRPMVYSLSPGFRPSTISGDIASTVTKARAVAPLVNMYRVTSDWHGRDPWQLHFEIAHAMTPMIGAKGAHGLSWPDLDMLNPFDDTPSFVMQHALWTMARSPLIYGGDMRKLHAGHPHVAVMSAPGFVKLRAGISESRQISFDNDTAVWAGHAAAGKGASYVALFRFGGSSGEVCANVADLPGADSTEVLTTLRVTDVVTGKAMPSVPSGGRLCVSLQTCDSIKGSKGECARVALLEPENNILPF